MRRVLIFFAFLVQETFAQRIDGQVELAGFVLGQEKSVVHAELGRPFQQSKQDDGWIYEFHTVKPDTSVYAVFKYSPSDENRIYAIELVGDGGPYAEMAPFVGLKLGDSKERVAAALGKPSKTESVEEPAVVTQFYLHKNYSVDIDNKGSLYGIQIFGNILEQQPHADPSIKGFKNALLTKNTDSLIVWMTPDVELHKDGKVITYSKGARTELNKKDGEFVKLLLGDSGSVWYAFAKEFAEGTSESRLHPELNQHVMVDKFFDSNVLSEIVFKPHAGKWKVYEIKFR